MTNTLLLRVRMGLLAIVLVVSPMTFAETHESTRVPDENHHVRRGSRSYPHRGKAAYILKELDLRPGDDVVDVGAGDGWWTQQMAEEVGADGTTRPPDRPWPPSTARSSACLGPYGSDASRAEQSRLIALLNEQLKLAPSVSSASRGRTAPG